MYAALQISAIVLIFSASLFLCFSLLILYSDVLNHILFHGFNGSVCFLLGLAAGQQHEGRKGEKKRAFHNYNSLWRTNLVIFAEK